MRISYAYLKFEPCARVLPVTSLYVSRNLWPTDDAGARRGTSSKQQKQQWSVFVLSVRAVRMPCVFPSYTRARRVRRYLWRRRRRFLPIGCGDTDGRWRGPGEWCQGVRPRARFTSGRAPPPSRRSVSVRVPPAPVRHDRRTMFTH